MKKSDLKELIKKECTQVHLDYFKEHSKKCLTAKDVEEISIKLADNIINNF